MRRLFASLLKQVARILLLAFFTSGVAMAAYLCPQDAGAPEIQQMQGMPCVELDKENPIQCGKHQAGTDVTQEQISVAPTISPFSVSAVQPAIEPSSNSAILTPYWVDAALDPNIDPPYLRTLRLRI